MVLDLTPRDYLEMLTEEYLEYRDNPLSMRKAINCCGLSNALPEVITAHRNPTDPAKVLKDKTDAYREQLQEQCKAHLTVRDFCEYSKHVKLGRKSVSVNEAERLSAPNPRCHVDVYWADGRIYDGNVDLFVLRHTDGREEYMHEVLEQVIASWNAILDENKL